MTLVEQRTLLTDLVQLDLDNMAGESPASADLTAQINFAQREASKFVRLYYPKVTFTPVASQAIYDIQKISATAVVDYRVVRPYFVTINGSILCRPDGYRGMWTFEDLLSLRASWQSESDAVPTAAVRFSSNKMILSNPPTAAVVSGGNNYISGTILAPDLVNDADISILPVEAHESICYLAAIFAAEPLLAVDEAVMRVANFNKRAMSNLMEIRDENVRLISRIGTVQGQESEDLLFV